MKRWTTLVMLLIVAACGDDDAVGGDADASGLDIRFPDGVIGDTSLATDSGATSTTDTGPTQATDTVVDSADMTVLDTAIEDSAIEDSAVEDSAVEDTAIEDTAVEDTTPPADTMPTDTTVADTTPADTTVEDTAPVKDTAPEDTASEDDTAAPACQLGGCDTDVSTAGTTCATAYTIGRPNAQTGFGHMASTVGAGNNSDFPQTACGDSGPDRFYKIYLKVGEQLWVNANPDPASFDVTFGLYRGANCETPITCVDNDVSGTTPDSMPYQAVEEGWHVLVVDGRASQGNYSVVVTLDCQEDNCCCE